MLFSRQGIKQPFAKGKFGPLITESDDTCQRDAMVDDEEDREYLLK